MKYLLGILVIIVVLLLTFGNGKTVVDNTDYSYVKVLEDSISNLNIKGDSLKAKSDSIELITDTMYITLNRVKEIHDTVRIIEVQDSIIVNQREEITTLKTRINIKDLIIEQSEQKYDRIIKDKDSEILTLEKAIEIEKRKRVITIITGGLLVIGVIALAI